MQRNIFTSLKFCLSRTDKFNVSPCFVQTQKLEDSTSTHSTSIRLDLLVYTLFFKREKSIHEKVLYGIPRESIVFYLMPSKEIHGNQVVLCTFLGHNHIDNRPKIFKIFKKIVTLVSATR